jgi:hypothetical protein
MGVVDQPAEHAICHSRITQLLRQGDAQVFKKYSQMKLQMKREALGKINHQANESGRSLDTGKPN